MYRFVALVFVFAAAACGGGDAPRDNPFGGDATSTATPSQQVLGERTTAPTTAPTAIPTEYTVAEGDTLSGIAAKLGTTVDALVLANQLTDADSLVIGQVLKVSPAATSTAPPAASTTPAATPTR